MPTPAARKLSRLRKPQDMSLETWQRELRRQFGREQPFTLKNTGAERLFSDFQVSNPQNASTYHVASLRRFLVPPQTPAPASASCSAIRKRVSTI